MARRTPQEWQLFLDESGPLDGVEHSVIAGLLVPHARSVEWDHALRQALHRTFPAVPFPMHASTLAISTSRVAGCLLSPVPNSARDEAVHRRCAEAVHALRGAPPHAVAEFFASIERGKMPTHLALSTARAWLTNARPRAAAALRALVEEQDRELAVLLRTSLFATDGIVVGAAHLPHHDGVESIAGHDRYRELVEVVFERVLTLLWKTNAHPVRVWVRAEGRDLPAPELGSALPLRSSDLAAAAARADRCAWFEPRGEVRLVPDRPESKSASMHPGLVLADFVSHRLRRHIHMHQFGYDEIGRWFAADLGASILRAPRCSDSVGALPTVASLGLPRVAVAAALAGAVPVPLAAVTARWPREQAERWVGAAAQLLRGKEARS